MKNKNLFMKSIKLKDLGSIEYKKAWDLQEELLQKGLNVKSLRFKNPDAFADRTIDNYLLLCTHPHVYTLGKSGSIDNLLVNQDQMEKLGVQFYKTNRGGDITYHGPGQLVAYPVLDLEQYETDLNKYMRNLEEVVILTLKEFGIESGRLEGSTGVWLDPGVVGKERKICAMGVRSSRWITLHGLALNMNADLQFFNFIIPCGINDKAVTSMEKELGAKVDEGKVSEIFKTKFEEVFSSVLVEYLP